MSVRPTMASLIDRTRTLIADPNSAAFSDDQVQDALDSRRTEQRFVLLEPQPTFLADRQILYLDYYSDTPNWESDILLQDANYQPVTPSLSEELVGHWTFAVQPNGVAVRATGKTYDLYAAAADLLESWAAQVMLQFDVTTGRDQFLRSQKFEKITALAAHYRELAQIETSPITQSEWTPDHDGGGVTYPSLGAIYGTQQ
jgi:hypothetical protein